MNKKVLYSIETSATTKPFRFRGYWSSKTAAPALQTWYDGDDHNEFYVTIPSKKNLSSYDLMMNATWPDKISLDDQDWFLDTMARKVENGGDFIYLRDIKDLTVFTVLNDISTTFANFFWTESVDRFLRALIVYFQYFLQVWNIIKFRTDHSDTLMRNPRSAERENKWRNGLNDLRYILSREYCAIIGGYDDSTYFHHLGPNRDRKSAPQMDNLVFELLYKYSGRVVELALGEKGNPVIADEISRLFRPPGNPFRIKGMRDKFSALDRKCLEDPFKSIKTPMDAPVVQELYRLGRNPILKILGHWPNKLIETSDTQLKLLQMMYLCSEKHLVRSNIKVGILGQRRSLFNTMLDLNAEDNRCLRFIKPDSEPWQIKYRPTLEKESITPAIKEKEPQLCDLNNFVIHKYDRKQVSKKWANYLKLNERLAGSTFCYKETATTEKYIEMINNL